jgi:hypothetical protein
MSLFPLGVNFLKVSRKSAQSSYTFLAFCLDLFWRCRPNDYQIIQQGYHIIVLAH